MALTLTFVACAGVAEDARTHELSGFGELDLSYEVRRHADNEWLSNTSKFGLKGNLALGEDTRLVYRFEQGVDPIHGGLRADTLFSTRNTFVGVENVRFGTLLVGTHDTPLKMAQGDIDLFNNQLGDIKGLVPGEVRARDSVLYRSPAFAGVTVDAMYVPNDDDFGNSWSVSMAWSSDAIDFAVAADSDMRKNDRPVSATAVYDTYRASARTRAGDWTLGVLGQRSQREFAADWEHALIVSAGRPIGPWKLDFQWGRSTIGDERTKWLAGLSRQFAPVRLYGIVSHTLNDDVRDATALAVGVEYKFP